ncbi:MAG TPA: ATP-binding protein [Gammaproteobacteria bacterium]|nr:ATP-binding protein [Gammaproteobacteria bacterium]
MEPHVSIVHLEDDAAHAELIRRAFAASQPVCDIRLTSTRKQYLAALDETPPDLILSDNRGYDIEGLEALKLARQRFPSVPFLFVCSTFQDPAALQAAGATACLLKSDLPTLTATVKGLLERIVAPRLDFKRLFEASPDILLVLLPDSPRFTIVGASRSRLAITHTGPEQFGRSLFEMFPDNPDDTGASGTSNLRASLERVLSTRAPDSMAVQRYDIRDERGRFVSKYWSPKNIPVLSDGGEVLYILHRVEDVTELVRATEAGEELRGRTREMELEVVRRSQELAQMNQELRQANLRLGELDAAKTVFFSNISHEFRTPLTLMLGPLEDSLAEPPGALPPKQRERLELVHRSARRLLKLVNALLDFSRLEAGRMQALYAPLDLAQRTRELASSFQSAASKAGLRLELDCPPLDEPAWADPEMWEKIVLNLLSNAFKFTFEGGIAVRLRAAEQHFELTVRDTGTGIPAADLPRVFERFHRVEGAQSRSHEGSGIGLAMVRELTRLHGGEVSVQSTPGKGSTFTVCIPRGKAHLPPEAVQAEQAAPVSPARATAHLDEVGQWVSGPQPEAAAAMTDRGRVLLADDNPDMRRYIRELLEPHYRVEVVEDGQAALERALASPPDLVLSDVMMPRRDGFGLLRALREAPSTRDLPVILLSARAGEEDSVQGLDAGADDYLIKPFSGRELLARVRTHLEHSRLRRRWARELEQINRELEAFSVSVSHDLRGPLRSISGFAQLLQEDYGATLDKQGRDYLQYVIASSRRMSELIEDLLDLSRVTRATLKRGPVDLTALAQGVVAALRGRDSARRCEVEVQDGMAAEGDPRLITILLENLVGNAWKFTSKKSDARIVIGAGEHDGEHAFFVRDNGAGFDMEHASRLFAPFQRLHSEKDFEGTGIGLATVQRIVARHGGRVWVEAEEDKGAAFYFTLAEGQAQKEV